MSGGTSTSGAAAAVPAPESGSIFEWILDWCLATSGEKLELGNGVEFSMTASFPKQLWGYMNDLKAQAAREVQDKTAGAASTSAPSTEATGDAQYTKTFLNAPSRLLLSIFSEKLEESENGFRDPGVPVLAKALLLKYVRFRAHDSSAFHLPNA